MQTFSNSQKVFRDETVFDLFRGGDRNKPEKNRQVSFPPDPKQKTLSILVRTHNDAKGMMRLLDSLALQDSSLEECELVVIDDASTDGTQDVLTKWEVPEGLGMFLLVNDEKEGFGRCLNRLVAQSSGRYIWMLETNCELASNALSSVMEELCSGLKDAIMVNDVSEGGMFCGRVSDYLSRGWKITNKIRSRRAVGAFGDYLGCETTEFFSSAEKVLSVGFVRNAVYRRMEDANALLTMTETYCSQHSFSLIEISGQRNLARAGLLDEWVSSFMRIIADMYEMRKRLKDKNVINAWSNAFLRMVMNFNSGIYTR